MSEQIGHGEHAEHGHGEHGHDDHPAAAPGYDWGTWPWVLALGLGWMALFGTTWWLASFW